MTKLFKQACSVKSTNELVNEWASLENVTRLIICNDSSTQMKLFMGIYDQSFYINIADL